MITSERLRRPNEDQASKTENTTVKGGNLLHDVLRKVVGELVPFHETLPSGFL